MALKIAGSSAGRELSEHGGVVLHPVAGRDPPSSAMREGRSGRRFPSTVETLDEIIRQGQTVAVQRLPPRLAYEFTTAIASVIHVLVLMRGMNVGHCDESSAAKQLKERQCELAGLYGDWPARLSNAVHAEAYRILLERYEITRP